MLLRPALWHPAASSFIHILFHLAILKGPALKTNRCDEGYHNLMLHVTAYYQFHGQVVEKEDKEYRMTIHGFVQLKPTYLPPSHSYTRDEFGSCSPRGTSGEPGVFRGIPSSLDLQHHAEDKRDIPENGVSARPAQSSLFTWSDIHPTIHSARCSLLDRPCNVFSLYLM